MELEKFYICLAVGGKLRTISYKLDYKYAWKKALKLLSVGTSYSDKVTTKRG